MGSVIGILLFSSIPGGHEQLARGQRLSRISSKRRTGGCWPAQVFETHSVDCALLFNGRQSITRVAFELFRQKGVRVLTHETPFFQPGHIMVKPNARCWSTQPFADFWRAWGDVPLTKAELEQTRNWLISRRYGKRLTWYAYNSSVTWEGNLKEKLSLTKGKKLMSLFTSSTEETAGDRELEGAYEVQSTWVQDVVDWVKDRDDVELVIRVHPHLAGKSGLARANDEFNFYKAMKAANPRNTRIIMPDEPLNSYALMDEADVGLTFGSSTGIEMAMLGKPIRTGRQKLLRGWVSHHKCAPRESSVMIWQGAWEVFSARELRREAYSLAYYYVFEFEMPFPLVSVFGVMDVELNYQGSEALGPGRDETWIVSAIISWRTNLFLIRLLIPRGPDCRPTRTPFLSGWKRHQTHCVIWLMNAGCPQ